MNKAYRVVDYLGHIIKAIERIDRALIAIRKIWMSLPFLLVNWCKTL